MRVRVVKVRDLQPATAAGAVMHDEADLTRPVFTPLYGVLRGLVIDRRGRRTSEPVTSIEAALLRQPEARIILHEVYTERWDAAKQARVKVPMEPVCSTPIRSASKEGEFTMRKVVYVVTTQNSTYRLESVVPFPPLPSAG